MKNVYFIQWSIKAHQQWETLGDIIYREHFLCNTEKTSGGKK